MPLKWIGIVRTPEPDQNTASVYSLSLLFNINGVMAAVDSGKHVLAW